LGIIKTFAAILLGFLLLCSLSIFGLAHTVNSTALNEDFINSQIDKLNIADIADEAIDEQLEEEDIPQAVRDSLDSILPDLERYIVDESSIIIDQVYAYIKGESSSLDLAQLARGAVPDATFINSLLDTMELGILVEEFINEKIGEAELNEIAYLEDYIAQAASESADSFETAIRQIITGSVGPAADYALGITSSLSLSFSIESILDDFKTNLFAAIMASPPPELAPLSPLLLEQALEDIWAQYFSGIPVTLEIDEELVGYDMQADVSKSLTDAEETLQDVRDGIELFKMGYWITIAIIALLIAGIILLQRQVRGSCLILGIIFLIYGIFEYVGIIIAKSVADSQIPDADMPASFNSWATNLVSDVLNPLEILAIGSIVLGVILLLTSFLYRRQQS